VVNVEKSQFVMMDGQGSPYVWAFGEMEGRRVIIKVKAQFR